MKIIVPEDIGSDLKVLEEGKCKAVVADLFYGLSDAGKPKVTLKWQLTSNVTDDDGNEHEAEGENVLDIYSLQPQALWRINSLYKQVTGEDIPHGDFEPEQFVAMISESLKGEEFALVLHNETPPGQAEERTRVEKAAYIG